ncbi:hypothetical protein PMI33_00288 [Pseudomonas sp. GM67]|nr:hypothetical protein PMI33_00288 [Pseudomonas sp. GM67]
MRFMIIVKASPDSEAGIMPSEELPPPNLDLVFKTKGSHRSLEHFIGEMAIADVTNHYCPVSRDDIEHTMPHVEHWLPTLMHTLSSSIYCK